MTTSSLPLSHAAVIFGMSCMLLAGCANDARADGEAFYASMEARVQVFASKPDRDQAITLARQALELSLKDAESARYRWGELVRAQRGDFISGEYGWVLRVQVNARNSFGAYTGYQARYVFLSTDHAVDITDEVSERRARIL